VSRPHRRRRTALAALALSLALSLLVSACGGGDDDGAAQDEPPVPLVAPLTGLPVADPQLVNRPALLVKIDNAPQARPQTGLDKADVVYEEMVEGGIVRFLAVFHSQEGGSVGPVRSVRPVDADIVTPIRGLFSYAGGAAQYKALVARAPVRLVGIDELQGGYIKRRGRSAPHNLYAETKKLYEAAGGDMTSPAPLFTYLPAGQPFAPAGAGPVTSVTVNISPASRATWDFDPAGNVWLRGTNGTPHTVEGGPQLRFSNVVVQFVQYRNTGNRDAAGNPVPDATVIGSGEALVLSAGKLVKARWTKNSSTEATIYADSAGQRIPLTPGTTWVTLAPIGATTQAR
jgi:hypothetical protein